MKVHIAKIRTPETAEEDLQRSLSQFFANRETEEPGVFIIKMPQEVEMQMPELPGNMKKIGTSTDGRTEVYVMDHTLKTVTPGFKKRNTHLSARSAPTAAASRKRDPQKSQLLKSASLLF